MTFPAAWTVIPVTGTYINRDGNPCEGWVSFSSPQIVLGNGTVLTPQTITFQLDSTGSFSGSLPATDDPLFSPANWAYTVLEKVPDGRQPFDIQVPHTSAGIDMSTVVPVVPPGELYPFVNGAALASGTGAQLVGYTIPDTGGVLRTLYDRAQDLPSVKDFGAKGDGATDDYAAFAACGSALSSAAKFVPAGTYVIGTNATLGGLWVFAPGAILKPSAGVTLTFNNTLVADHFQIFDATLGAFTLTGEATRIKVEWFGVLPSNTAAANTAAFNAAISALPATDGAYIEWGVGTFNGNGFTHSKEAIVQVGCRDGTWIINNTTNSAALEALGATNYYNKFIGFRIGQASGVTPVAGNCGVHLQSRASTLRDIHIFNYPAAPYDGVYIDGCQHLVLSNVECTNLLNNGIHFGNGCSDVFADNLYCPGNGANGFYFNGCSGVYGSKLNGYGNGISAFYFDDTGHVNGSGTINEYALLSDCVGDTSNSSNWEILNLADSQFNGCWGSTQKAGGSIYVPGFEIKNATSTRLSFNNCLALHNNGSGFFVDAGATDIVFTGCLAKANGVGAAYTDGFYIGASAAVQNVTVVGCRAISNPGRGIHIGGFASDYLVISSCNNQGNTGGTIQNNSTGTHNAIGTGANV